MLSNQAAGSLSVGLAAELLASLCPQGASCRWLFGPAMSSPPPSVGAGLQTMMMSSGGVQRKPEGLEGI